MHVEEFTGEQEMSLRLDYRAQGCSEYRVVQITKMHAIGYALHTIHSKLLESEPVLLCLVAVVTHLTNNSLAVVNSSVYVRRPRANIHKTTHCKLIIAQALHCPTAQNSYSWVACGFETSVK